MLAAYKHSYSYCLVLLVYQVGGGEGGMMPGNLAIEGAACFGQLEF